LRRLLLGIVLVGMAGCGKPASENELRDACVAHQLHCYVSHRAEGSFAAIATKPNQFGNIDIWAGSAQTAALARGELLRKLNGPPTWPGSLDSTELTK